MKADNFSVGSVLFVLSKNEMNVYPVRVVEEVYRKNLKGDSVSYIVQDKTGGVFDLEDIEGAVFSSSADVRSTMFNLLKKKVDEVVDGARRTASEVFETYTEPTMGQGSPMLANDVANLQKPDQQVDDMRRVQMPDGSFANVSINIPSDMNN